ncbi:EamA-like transporter family protein [Balneicella halophila]|uniref:EamA-like transporter family protein n=1 Tax=Balneicella halophila TaxID=1537566 RepID=A0A7L4UR45_BALHA|nr:DMT family transporter [Balneicella halophila]PVX51982.1 EamA-like transporter family protein [Balneicella halophila]
MKRFLPIILLLIISLAWGASFSVRFEALKAYSDTQVALFQIFGAGIFFLPLMWKTAKKLSRENFPILFLSGFLGNVLTSVFYALAQSRTDVSVTSILSALGPIVVFIEGILIYKQRFSLSALLALLLGLLGVCILIFGDSIAFNIDPFSLSFQESLSFQNTSLLGIFYVLMAVIAGSSNIVLIGYAMPKLSGTEIATITFMIFGPIAFVFLLGTNFSSALESEAFAHSSWMLVLLAFITFIGTVGFNELIKRSSPLLASLSTYLILFIGVAMGVFLTGSEFEWKHFWSIICIFIGVYWINKPQVSNS